MERFKKISIILIIFGFCLFGEMIFGIIAFTLACLEAVSLYFIFPILAETLKERALEKKEKKIEKLEKELKNLRTEVK